MIKSLISLFLFANVYLLQAQPQLSLDNKMIPSQSRTIAVSGTAEKLFDADRLYVTLGYGEYWKEEFEEGKEWNDFRTKVPMENVEPKIIDALKKLGFKDDDIVVEQAGNNYRQQGKDFLVKKSLELKIEDFSMMNKIISMMDMRGIDMMNISRMEIDDIEDRKLEVKIEALQAARYKAEKMVKALGDDLGEVIHISESVNTFNNDYKMSNRMMMSDASVESGSDYVSPLDNYRKMKLQFTVSAVFAIE